MVIVACQTSEWEPWKISHQACTQTSVTNDARLIIWDSIEQNASDTTQLVKRDVKLQILRWVESTIRGSYEGFLCIKSLECLLSGWLDVICVSRWIWGHPCACASAFFLSYEMFFYRLQDSISVCLLDDIVWILPACRITRIPWPAPLGLASHRNCASDNTVPRVPLG